MKAILKLAACLILALAFFSQGIVHAVKKCNVAGCVQIPYNPVNVNGNQVNQNCWIGWDTNGTLFAYVYSASKATLQMIGQNWYDTQGTNTTNSGYYYKGTGAQDCGSGKQAYPSSGTNSNVTDFTQNKESFDTKCGSSP